MRHPLALLMLACLAPRPAPAEVLSSSAAGFALEQRIEVATDPQRTWRALIEDIGAWWPRDHTWWGEESTLSLEARAGGCFCERAGERSAEHLRVVFADAPNTLRLLGGLGPLQGMGLNGALEFSISAREDGGSEVRMRYTVGGYSASDLSTLAPVVDRVQGLQLDGLRAHLAAAE